MRNCLLVFVIIIFVVLVGPFFVFFNLNRTVLAPEFFKNGLTETKVYERLLSVDPNDIVKLFPKEAGAKQGEQEGLNAEMIANIQKAVPAEALKRAFESNLDNAGRGVLHKGEKTITLELSDLKAAVLANNPTQDVQYMVNMIKDSYSFDVPPGTLKFTQYIANSSKYILIYAVSLAALLLFAFLLAKGGRSKFRAISLILLIGGIIVLIPYVISLVLSLPFQKLGLPASLSRLISDLILYLKNGVARLFLIEGLSLIGAAVVLFLLGFLFKKPQKSATSRSNTPPPPAPQQQGTKPVA